MQERACVIAYTSPFLFPDDSIGKANSPLMKSLCRRARAIAFEDKARDRVPSSDSASERNAVFRPQGPAVARMDFFNGLLNHNRVRLVLLPRVPIAQEALEAVFRERMRQQLFQYVGG